MNRRGQSLRGLVLALAVFTIALVWVALASGAWTSAGAEQAIASALTGVDEGAVRRAAACYTTDTSRPEWLGRSTYLPVMLREY